MSESQMRAQNATKQRSVFVGRELFDELFETTKTLSLALIPFTLKKRKKMDVHSCFLAKV